MPRAAQLSDEPLRVSVGLVADSSGRYLVNRRKPDTHMAGAWEFPGGKRNGGEGAAETLRRELDEELGISVRRAQLLLVVAHDYSDRRVQLDVFTVLEYSGEPHGREGQELRWVGLTELDTIGLLAADKPIIAALKKSARISTD